MLYCLDACRSISSFARDAVAVATGSQGNTLIGHSHGLRTSRRDYNQVFGVCFLRVYSIHYIAYILFGGRELAERFLLKAPYPLAGPTLVGRKAIQAFRSVEFRWFSMILGLGPFRQVPCRSWAQSMIWIWR